MIDAAQRPQRLGHSERKSGAMLARSRDCTSLPTACGGEVLLGGRMQRIYVEFFLQLGASLRQLYYIRTLPEDQQLLPMPEEIEEEHP